MEAGTGFKKKVESLEIEKKLNLKRMMIELQNLKKVKC